MLVDPQTVSVDSSATKAGTNLETLPRISLAGSRALYSKADGLISLEVTHSISAAKRRRHLVKMTETKTVADPYTAVNTDVTCSAHIVVDEPRWGFSDAEVLAVVKRLLGQCVDATMSKVLAGES